MWNPHHQQAMMARMVNPAAVGGLFGGSLSPAEIQAVQVQACRIGKYLGGQFGDAVGVGHVAVLTAICFARPAPNSKYSQIKALVVANYHAWCL